MMTREQFQRAAEALGKDTGMKVLNELANRKRGTASALAEATGLHTATVMKHLGALAAAGLLETRMVRGKTREMVEYSLPSPIISLSLDMSKPGDKGGAWKFIETVLQKAERVYGAPMDPPVSGDAYDLFLAMETRYGRERTLDIFLSARNTMEQKGLDEHISFLDTLTEAGA